MTIPSPVTLSRSSYQQGVTDKIYPSWENLFLEYAHLVTAAEVSDMVNDGVSYVQLDAPHYTRFVIPNRQKQITDLGVDLRRELELAIAAENICLRAARHAGTAASSNITTAVHICLGTFILGPQGPLGGAGEYDETLVAHLIEALDADLFLIEDPERTGSLEAFRNLPKNKIISLGIVNTRDPRWRRRMRSSTGWMAPPDMIPIENLSICPNCGFSGAAVETWITEDIEKRKLEVMVRTSGENLGLRRASEHRRCPRKLLRSDVTP